MNKTKIEWCDYTWNPVVGCENNCHYCYARKINDRFHFIKNWNEPEFFKDRLDEPLRVKKPSGIFVCSMADLFSGDMPFKWIRDVIAVATKAPWHRYYFLTKFPEHYKREAFSDNCFLGTTITGPHDQERASILLSQPNQNRKFLSIEPLLGPIVLPAGSVNFTEIILGAQTGTGSVKPKREWIPGNEAGCFYKESMYRHFPDLQKYRRQAWVNS